MLTPPSLSTPLTPPLCSSSHPMFLRQLSSPGSAFLPRSHPVLCRVGFRSSGVTSSHLLHSPTPYPWSSVQGVPPWPPRLPAAHQLFSGSFCHPGNINQGNLAGSRCSLYTSATLMMERPDRDREPPHKRRKSVEEKRSVEGWQGHRGGSVGSTAGKIGGSKREQQHLDSSTDRRSRPNHCFKDRSQDRGSDESGRGVSKDNSRGKDVEWTRTRDKHRSRKDGAGQDATLNRGTSVHQRGWQKHSQSASTQTSQPEPEQGQVPQHKHNPWFRGRGGCEDRCRDGGQWAGLLTQPLSKSLPSRSWQEAAASRQPLPPGTCPPVGQQEHTQPMKCKLAPLQGRHMGLYTGKPLGIKLTNSPCSSQLSRDAGRHRPAVLTSNQQAAAQPSTSP